MRGLADLWERAAALVRAHRDVIDARVPRDDARGWAAWLLALDDDALDAIEGGGAWPDDAPSSLAALVRDTRDVCALPSLAAHADDAPRAARAARDARHEKARKAAQVDAFAALVQPLAARATRVVDVGSGHGHVTREIAARIGAPVVGLERDAALVERARALARAQGGGAGHAATFAQHDVVREGLAFTRGDVAVGLHACGALGDALVVAAAQAHASAALVGCCLQKRPEPARRSLTAPDDDALAVPKHALGLSNLTARDDGVEATRAKNIAARTRRLALAHLLERVAPGSVAREGAELRGLNRRAAHAPFDELVARAFSVRSLAAPSRTDVDDALAWAEREHARVRRLALPRQELARVLEAFTLVDRARFLEERGHEVVVGAVFPLDISARNLALVAHAS